jgi:hypothetical protein
MVPRGVPVKNAFAGNKGREVRAPLTTEILVNGRYTKEQYRRLLTPKPFDAFQITAHVGNKWDGLA